MRYLYSFVLYLMLPWVLLRLWTKGWRVPGYRRNWKERFGHVDVQLVRPVVWFHAVSVGEVRAAEPLIRTVLKRHPELSVLVTTTTPTGRETAQRLFGDAVSYHYLPYDLPNSVKRFLDTVKPVMAVILETEIWPNLYYQLEQNSIPLLLVNARLSQKSLQGYLRLRALSRPALRSVRHIAVQSEQDAQRFRRLGAGAAQLSVMGNLKFEMQLPDDFPARTRALKDSLGSERYVWVAGSTHAGEEAQLLAAHRRVLKSCANALLVIAPRHPERAGEIAALCRKSGIGFQLSTKTASLADDVPVLIVDTLGELVYFYGVALAVFVGGSLVSAGGHNPVEPILAGAPVITGPNTDNFKSIYQGMIHSNAGQMIETETALAYLVCEWFKDAEQRKTVVEAGLRLVEKNRGALQRCLQLLENTL
ncbi:MAG: lipid IV(A) 3-deoxy-D-manno-octulosonic acid transferase [Gammaproteobacteria bacterium]|nr:MAG: lipid IV(A) 3-deoxy-D-manno-octulosonic acid transferase [Gammaproteobacteria bacterium]